MDNMTTPRGGPVPKRGKRHGGDENIDDTYMESTYRGGLSFDANDSLAEYLQPVMKEHTPAHVKNEGHQEYSNSNTTLTEGETSVLTARDNYQCQASLHEDDTFEELMDIKKNTPTPVRKPSKLGRTPVGVHFDLPNEEVGVGNNFENTLLQKSVLPEVSILDLSTGNEKGEVSQNDGLAVSIVAAELKRVIPVNESAIHWSPSPVMPAKMTTPVVSTNDVTFKDVTFEPLDISVMASVPEPSKEGPINELIYDQAENRLEGIDEDTEEKILETATEKSNKTFEVERLRCFEVADCIKEICVNLSSNESFKAGIRNMIDSIEFDVVEYFSSGAADYDSFKNDFQRFLSLICDTIRQEEHQRLTKLHQQDKDGYDYMLEVERNKCTLKERQLKEACEKVEDANQRVQELQSQLADYTENRKTGLDELSQRNLDIFSRKCNFLEKKNKEMLAKVQQMDELKNTSMNLEYERDLLKLKVGLISKAQAIELYGPSIEQMLDDYLKSQSQI